MLISAFLSLLQATSVLVSLIVLISFHGFQVDGKVSLFFVSFWILAKAAMGSCLHLISLMAAFSSQVDRFVLNVVENGTSVNEQIEVDVENQTEVIRVPQHNDVDAVEIMNDFTAVSQL